MQVKLCVSPLPKATLHDTPRHTCCLNDFRLAPRLTMARCKTAAPCGGAAEAAFSCRTRNFHRSSREQECLQHPGKHTIHTASAHLTTPRPKQTLRTSRVRHDACAGADAHSCTLTSTPLRSGPSSNSGRWCRCAREQDLASAQHHRIRARAHVVSENAPRALAARNLH